MRVTFWDQEIFALCKSSSHHPSGWVPTSSAEVSIQEASAGYRTLAVCQNKYLPQVSQWVEGCGMRERAAVSPAAHPVHTCHWCCHAQGRTSTVQGQASQRVTPQYPYLLLGEQQGIPCTRCRNPLHNWAKGAAQEVLMQGNIWSVLRRPEPLIPMLFPSHFSSP